MNVVNTQMRVIELDINNPADRMKAAAFDKIEDTHSAINEFKNWLSNNFTMVTPFEKEGELTEEDIKNNNAIYLKIRETVITKYSETFQKYGIAV